VLLLSSELKKTHLNQLIKVFMITSRSVEYPCITVLIWGELLSLTYMGW